LLCHIANALVAFRDEMRMDFDLSDVQRKRYDEVLAGVRRSGPPSRRRRAPAVLPRRMVGRGALGLVGLCLPSEYGGGGLGALDTALCLEAFTEGGADAGLAFAVGATCWRARCRCATSAPAPCAVSCSKPWRAVT
jgi:alkylation response protein AidB-like acyl-CoA dehydrogenase